MSCSPRSRPGTSPSHWFWMKFAVRPIRFAIASAMSTSKPIIFDGLRGSGIWYGAPPSASPAQVITAPAGLVWANAEPAKMQALIKRYAMTFMVSEIYNRPMADFIEFIDVYKSFGERQILNGVSFTVDQG